MFALMLAMVLRTGLASAAPEPKSPTPPFDEASEKVRYATFIYRWHVGLFGDAQARRRWDGVKPFPEVPVVPAWPFIARGVLTNPRTEHELKWVKDGFGPLSEVQPHPFDTLVSLMEYCYEDRGEPEVCVPGACYFIPRCEYGDLSFWVALREEAGAPRVAGVLLWTKSRKVPAKDKQVARWIKQIDAPPPH